MSSSFNLRDCDQQSPAAKQLAGNSCFDLALKGRGLNPRQMCHKINTGFSR
jgi:hypothetical protein